MSHIVGKSAFKSLEERINRFPQGAPPSETLYKILAHLYTEEEAALVAQLPIKPFTVDTAAKIWKRSQQETEYILDKLASKALLLDSQHNGVRKFVMPPPMAGFFEFALMRTGGNIDQKVLSELFYQYLNVEEDFMKELFLGTETRMGRTFVSEDILPQQDGEGSREENSLIIMDYERASHIIKEAKHIGLSMCYCRHKMLHLDQACSAPMDTCLTFDNTAASLIKHGYARKIDASECLDVLNQSYEANLVQCGENVRNQVSFLCNCCGCCCEGLKMVKKFGALHPIETTNFLPKVEHHQCVGCGKCARICPIEAISMKEKQPLINEEICLGCGVCIRNCPTKAIKLTARENRLITPANTIHRTVLMAIEKGTLADLVFDNKAFASHRAMGHVLSTILKLPLVNQLMASKQMKSVYLDKLLSKSNM